MGKVSQGHPSMLNHSADSAPPPPVEYPPSSQMMSAPPPGHAHPNAGMMYPPYTPIPQRKYLDNVTIYLSLNQEILSALCEVHNLFLFL